jgi:5'-deoxynucleotidase YfbR-like HD superfamily hydrolase
MSVVKRWGVVQTLRQQSDAEHCFNVARIAVRLAKRFFPNGYVANRGNQIFGAVVVYALHHDDDESVTGDFPSYMKPYVDVEAALLAVPAYQDEEFDMSGSADDDPWVKFLVKCADYIDACIFLRMEISLGNKSVTYHLRHLEARFRKYLEKMAVELSTDASQVYDWYGDDIIAKMFGGNGQYVSEIDGFPKS